VKHHWLPRGGIMDTQGFRDFLEHRNITPEQAGAYAGFVQGFVTSREAEGAPSLAAAFPAFSRRMLAEGTNTVENYRAIALYGRFVQDNALLLAAIELLDGREVPGNLHRKTGELLGQARRDELFAGLEAPPLGMPNAEKPAAILPMLQRLEQAEPDACREILAGGLRDLPDEYFAQEKASFEQCADVDEYLWRKKRALVADLRKLQREGGLYFNQEITDEVIEYVRRNPEIGQGVRAGHIIYETKIPHQAKEYLAETDEAKKRYYYCHCPWVKESLRAGRSDIPPVFCNCSAAFMKKPWDMIFGQSLQADVLETVLQGDLRCRFAIHLPE
jgi:hypothetical protein